MKSKEQAVRDAAAALKTAIDDAAAEGLHTQWPSNAESLPSIAISETAKAKVVVSVSTIAVSPEMSAKAGAAAQKAADKAIEKASDKA